MVKAQHAKEQTAGEHGASIIEVQEQEINPYASGEAHQQQRMLRRSMATGLCGATVVTATTSMRGAGNATFSTLNPYYVNEQAG